MLHLTYVAPYFAPATRRFIGALAGLVDRRQLTLSLISCDPQELLPEPVRRRLSGHYRVLSCFDAGQLVMAAKRLARELGPIGRLIGTLEDMQVPLALARQALGVPGMQPETARNVRDKARMKDVLRAAGVPCARHALATSAGEALSFAEAQGFPLVIKPPAGAGARSTYQLSDMSALREVLGAMPPSPEHPALLEEFVAGDEHSFDCVSIGGEPVWHSLTRYYPTPLEVLRNPWIQWCVLLPRETDDAHWDDIRAAGGAALRALGVGTALSHMEWFRRADGTIAISEVGARPPGAQFVSLMSLAHDTDMYAAWAELVAFERFSLPETTHAAGAAYLRGMGRGRVARIIGLEAAQREVGSLVVEAKLPAIGQRASGGYEGDGYVLVRHPETAVVKRALARLVSLIRVEYEDD